MSFTLRDYQVTHNLQASKAMKQHQHIIVQGAGGTGKTKQFVSIAWSAANKGSCVLVLTDRTMIYRQNIAEAQAIGINPNTPHNIEIHSGKVYVAMAQTLISRMYLLDQFNALPNKVIVLIDECHSGIFNSILDYLTNRLTAGFTATPHCKYAKHLPKYYNACVPGEQIDWLIQNDWLCSNTHIARGKKEMESHLTKSANGEYTETSQNDWFSQSGIYDGLIADIRSESFIKAMVFCASVKNAHETYNLLQAHGIKCCIGHSISAKLKEIGTTEKIEMDKYRDLNSGYDILISVSAYIAGFDFPEIDMLFMYRAYGSFISYMQSMFRANRKKPSMHFKVYDYGDNWKRHGLYYFDRPWNKLWNNPNAEKEQTQLGTYAIKECCNCGAMISLMNRVCKYCGTEQPENEQELKQGVLINITKEYDGLVGKCISSLSPAQLATYSKLKQKLQFCIRVAKSQRQKQLTADPNTKDNFLREFGLAMGYSPKWYNIQSEMLKKSKETLFYTDIVLK